MAERSFKEYVAQRFQGMFERAIKNFIGGDISRLGLSLRKVRVPGAWELADSEVVSVRVSDLPWSPENAKLFDCIVKADFLVRDANHRYGEDEEASQWFLLRCLESFDEDLDDTYIAYVESIEINNSKEFVALAPADAYQLLCSDSSLREWVSGGQFVFAEGYFVLADEEYITAKEGILFLTEKAKKNLARCAINIRAINIREHEYTTRPNRPKDSLGKDVCVICDIGCDVWRAEIDRRILVFHPKFQANFKYEEDDVYAAFRDHILAYDEDEEIELVKRLGDPTTTLCQCLWYLMEKRKWNYPETFYDRTGLHKNYHGKIKNDKHNDMSKDTLMAVCVGLRLNLRIIEKIFEKSENKLNYYKDPDKTYIRILENLPGLSLQDFNSVLEKAGIKTLGSTSKNDSE